MRFKFLAGVLLAQSGFSYAQETAAPPANPTTTPAASASAPAAAAASPPAWNGDLALGFVTSSGNASSSTLNLKFDLEYKVDPWDNLLTGTAYRARSDGTTTDEKYSIGDKLLYNLDPDQFLFGQGNYDNDHFGAVAERYSVSAGYGRHVLRTPTQTFDVDAGLGANRTREQDAHSFQSDPIAVFDGTYIWKLSANSQFKQTLRTEFSTSNTFINPVTELKLTIIKNFFAALGYEVRYNTHTPADTYHTDQITTINIGYTFGKPPATPPS